MTLALFITLAVIAFFWFLAFCLCRAAKESDPEVPDFPRPDPAMWEEPRPRSVGRKEE